MIIAACFTTHNSMLYCARTHREAKNEFLAAKKSGIVPKDVFYSVDDEECLGFLSDGGKFLSRREAYAEVKKCGQIDWGEGSIRLKSDDMNFSDDDIAKAKELTVNHNEGLKPKTVKTQQPYL